MPVILKGFMIITNSGAVMYAKKAQFSENIVLHTSVPMMCQRWLSDGVYAKKLNSTLIKNI